MRIADTKAGKRITAALLVKDGRRIGKILAHHTLQQIKVEVWNWEDEQDTKYAEGSTRGYYPRIADAINSTGITFGGIPAASRENLMPHQYGLDLENAGIEVWVAL